MKATAKANTNIALIKYWGKRDEELFLPMNSSLSITLDRFYTTTTVEFREDFDRDVFILDKEEASEGETSKVSKFLDKVRKLAGSHQYAVVTSDNMVPTAAGFASSASGYAALAAAASRALGLELSERELSILARKGSGSASRSVYGGFVEWQRGERADGEDSFASQILTEGEWDLSILSVMVVSRQKKVSSREGMKRTVLTSPFYNGWLSTVESDLDKAKSAIGSRNFEALGAVVESNALKMHATMLGAHPPVMYWQRGTLEVMTRIQELRESGIPAYFTIDAGPNVKVLCLPEDEERVCESLVALPTVEGVVVCHQGEGVRYF